MDMAYFQSFLVRRKMSFITKKNTLRVAFSIVAISIWSEIFSRSFLVLKKPMANGKSKKKSRKILDFLLPLNRCGAGDCVFAIANFK